MEHYSLSLISSALGIAGAMNSAGSFALVISIGPSCRNVMNGKWSPLIN